MDTITLKFGGSTLTGPESIERVCQLISAKSRKARCFVVVSALKGCTDRLLDISQAPPAQALPELETVLHWHRRTARSLLDAGRTLDWENAITAHVEAARTALGRKRRGPHDIARILALGEKLSAALLQQRLQRGTPTCRWLCSEQLLRTNGHPLRATLDADATAGAFAALDTADITLITGFCGGDRDGRTTLLGRNASDYSAAVVARYSTSRCLEIIGDTDGILSADPDYVPGASNIARLSRHDARLLARAGSGVLHPRTLEPLLGTSISLRLDNLEQAGGTVIGEERGQRRQSLIATWRPPLQARLDKTPALPQPLRRWQQQAPGHGVVSVFLAEHLDADVCHRNLTEQIARSGIRVSHSRLFKADKLLAYSVPPADLERLTRLLHSTLHPLHRETAVAVIGASGNVGRRTLELLLDGNRRQHNGHGTRLRIVAVCNSQRILWCKRHETDAEDLLQRLAAQPAQARSAERLLEELSGQCFDRLVVVDASASPEIAALYERFLARGIAIVTPNKLANSAGFERYARLAQIASSGATPYLYETTVGAALPVIKPLQELQRAGDKPIRIEAVLSGTIAYVLDRIQQDIPFSQAVAEAVALGYAEPDPLQDLSGEDVARKILILLRTCGIDAERAQIALTPLQAADASGGIPSDADAHWRALVRQARAEGKRLCYVAAFADGRIGVTLQLVGAESPFYRLRGTENALVYRSELYRDTPLTITGPGAGIGVTGAGVFNDVINAAENLPHRSTLAALAA